MWMATVGSTSSNLDQSGGYNNQLCSYYSSDYYERIASCGSANRTVSPSSEVDTVQVLGHGYFPVTLTDPSTSPNHWHAGLPPTWGTEEVVLNYTSFYAVEGVARRWGYVLFGANDSYDSMTPEYPLAVLSSRAAAHVTTEPYTAPGGPYAFYGYWNSHLDFGTGFSIGAAYLSSWNNLYVEGGGGFAWSTTSTGQQDAFTGLGGSSFATYFIDTWDTGTEIPIIIIVVDGISLARLKFRSHL
jgi:hypothetical protein